MKRGTNIHRLIVFIIWAFRRGGGQFITICRDVARNVSTIAHVIPSYAVAPSGFPLNGRQAPATALVGLPPLGGPGGIKNPTNRRP